MRKVKLWFDQYFTMNLSIENDEDLNMIKIHFKERTMLVSDKFAVDFSKVKVYEVLEHIEPKKKGWFR